MSEVALLNPQVENAVCSNMVSIVERALNDQKKALTTSVLDRETYLLKMGGVQVLERTLHLVKNEYDSNFKT